MHVFHNTSGDAPNVPVLKWYGMEAARAPVPDALVRLVVLLIHKEIQRDFENIGDLS